MYQEEDLVTRNAHLQYESSNIYYLEVMTNVNLKKNRSNVKVKMFITNKKVLSQGILNMWNINALALQGHSVKNNGTHGKVLSKGTLMWNIKALALTVQKLWGMLKFF